ncbi:hypothetical protein TNCV_3965491 [Trichonephila clavipes]|nr:hypothetical protein TNCV_3965491 [Trichonephila clavipes]
MYSAFAVWGYSKWPSSAACSLVMLVDGEESWEASDPQDVLLQNCGGTDQIRSVTCMVLKATDNDRRTTNPLPR